MLDLIADSRRRQRALQAAPQPSLLEPQVRIGKRPPMRRDPTSKPRLPETYHVPVARDKLDSFTSGA